MLATAAVAIGGVVLPASSASALVQVSEPQPRLHAGQYLTVGTRYRVWDGGPRAYRVTVLDPAHRVAFHRRGQAHPHWQMWHVRADHRGTWTTVYRVKDAQDHWHRWVSRTCVR